MVKRVVIRWIYPRLRKLSFFFVMPGLVPAIHVFQASRKKDVDARDKPGHDEFRGTDRT
jgi:hypothetical protein